MRKVKYRAWDGEKMRFAADGTTFFDSEGVFPDEVIAVTQQKGWKWMLFTGLCDKNGVEIFEGDILLIEIGERFVKAAVMYTLSYMGWSVANPNNTMEVPKYDTGEYIDGCALYKYVEWGYNNSPRLEVIGNVYETSKTI